MFDPRHYAGIAETALDRLVKLKAEAGKTLVYWVLGGWRKGLANPVAPTARDWAGRRGRARVPPPDPGRGAFSPGIDALCGLTWGAGEVIL